MQTGAKIYVAGHQGLLGRALVRTLTAGGFSNLVLRERRELDLTDGAAVAAFFTSERPEYVFLAAARVGGIEPNRMQPGEFLRENLLIQTHVLEAARHARVRKLLFYGSACAYPRACAQPMREEYLLTGPLEPTNEAYAMAKLAGITMCQAYRRQYDCSFICAIPANLYGPHDHFDLRDSHVIPAMLRKLHAAAVAGTDEVELWGTGTPVREFLCTDDMAAASLFLMQAYDDVRPINVGSGATVTIRELAQCCARVVGFRGRLRFNPAMPDGMPRKVLDSSRLAALGWTSQVGLEAGLAATYRWCLESGVLRGNVPMTASRSVAEDRA